MLIKYTGKYVNIYFIMKITSFSSHRVVNNVRSLRVFCRQFDYKLFVYFRLFWSFGHRLFFDFARVAFSGFCLYALDYTLTTCSSAMDLHSCYICGFVISG